MKKNIVRVAKGESELTRQQKFSGRERQLVVSKDLCRMSTISASGWPHCVPVSYVHLEGSFYVPSLRDSKKTRNLTRNRNVTIVIDNEENESGVMIECDSLILEGKRAQKLQEYMRKTKGWKNDETTAIIKLSPLRVSSWFLK